LKPIFPEAYRKSSKKSDREEIEDVNEAINMPYIMTLAS
jgi:hypothetical protein